MTQELDLTTRLCKVPGCTEEAYQRGVYAGYCLDHGKQNRTMPDRSTVRPLRPKHTKREKPLAESIAGLMALARKIDKLEQSKIDYEAAVVQWNLTLNELRITE